MDTLRNRLLSQKTLAVTLLLYIALSFAWVLIFIGGLKDNWTNHTFGFIYGGFSIWGGIMGLLAANKWGGWKSYMGRAILTLSIGLLGQAFGQYSFWYYNFALKIDVPYPGIPDIGYFGTIPFYIYGGYLIAKSVGIKFTIGTVYSRLQLFLIPLALITVAYFLFLRNYDLDLNDPLTTFLNFGYPLGQAVYISIAILTFSLSRKMLGGIMRFPILILIFAFLLQFLADYIFIYFHDLYFPASFIDYFYLLAYFTMSIGLIQLKVVADNLNHL